MPFTPFHMGPGCVMKALMGDGFSLTLFGFTQVVMDVQPLWHMLRGDGLTHGISHTYLGATLIAGFSLLAGRPVCQMLLNSWTPDPHDRFRSWLHGSRTISWPAAATGAFLGAYSHVLLDSMIHADVQPFAPFTDGNPMRGLVSFAALHVLCLGVGVLGFLGLVIRYMVESSA